MVEKNDLESLGPYRIESEVGSGAMGTVYKAVHDTLERSAAIKVLPRDLTMDPEYVSRFLREARVIATLRHDNVVQVYDAGEEGGKYFIAMEFVAGSTLADHMKKKGPLSLEEGLSLFRQAALGLAAAHEKGLIHRDIKPDNLLISEDGKTLRVADFGLVMDATSLTQLTATGACLGTPQYMSPEQADGEPGDPRTDLYSLGATFYQVFTGKPPYTSTTVMNLLFKHKFHAVPDPRSSHSKIPDNLSNLLMTLLAKRKEDRPESAKALVDLIDRVQKGEEIEPPPVFVTPIPEDPEASIGSIYGHRASGSNAPKAKIKAALALVCVFVLGLGWFVWSRNHSAENVSTGGSSAGGTVFANGSETNGTGKGASGKPVRIRPWDGKERIEAYGKSLGLAATQEFSLGKGVTMKLVLVPAGSFKMGSPTDEVGREDTELLHRVELSRPFYMGAFEVTQAQYEAVLGEGRNTSKWKEQRNPVETVSWTDALEFCQAMSHQIKRTVRLPTEAEWEYACRAGTATPFYFGETIDTEQANYDGDTVYGKGKPGTDRERTMHVGSFSPNPWGLYDTHGNVWEWCHDWHAGYPSEAVKDPKGPGFGNRRVQRGGSWYSTAEDCRSAHRDLDKPGDRESKYGFRVVVEIE